VADKRIRFGLGAVRNVGEGAIESIIAGRREGRYATLADLVERPAGLRKALVRTPS